MGQKVNPIGLRLGINRGWDSIWFAKKKEFGKYLIEDFKIRKYIKKNIINSGVSESTCGLQRIAHSWRRPRWRNYSLFTVSPVPPFYS